jgi:hypothetical protein
MPLARIDLPAGKPASYGRAVADVVYEAMIATLKAPKDDRFQVISEHGRDTLLIDPSYLARISHQPRDPGVLFHGRRREPHPLL